MRKLTMELAPRKDVREAQRSLFRDIYSYEILDELKMDHSLGVCVDLIECRLREGVSIEDVASIGKMEILNLLRSDGDRHTCLVRYREEESSKELLRQFDLDLINTTPTKLREDKYTVSVIGDQPNLTRYIDLMRTHIGETVKMSFRRAEYQRQDILAVLTDKQRMVLSEAHRSGYYDYPKRINSTKLAGNVHISKATLVEHLRKAESRLMEGLFAGY
jgi:predicted DNA binding protein